MYDKKAKEYRHNYYLAHKEKSHKQSMEWRKNNHEKQRIWAKQWSVGYRLRKRIEVLKHYGDKCKCCGETEDKFLTVDHINGGGRKHWKERGDKNIYIWLVSNKYPEGYQILCFNCNCGRSVNKGICPHKK